jgi:hypothetical protein
MFDPSQADALNGIHDISAASEKTYTIVFYHLTMPFSMNCDRQFQFI